MQESSGQKSIEGEDGIWAWDVLEKRKGIHNDSNEKHSRRSSSCSSSSSSRSSSLSQEYSTRHNSRSPLNRERKTRRRCSDDTDRSDSEERTRRGIPNRSKMNVSNKTTRKFRKHSSSKSPSRSPSCEESSLERKNVKRSKCARSRSPSNDKNIEKIEVNQKLIKSSGENILDTSFRENRSKERSCSIDPKGDKFDVTEHSYRKREAVPGSHVNNKDKEPNSRDKRKGDKVKARSRSKSKDKKLRLHKSRSRSCSVGRRSRSRSKGRSSRIRRANSPRRRSRSHSRGHYYRRKSSPRRRRSRSRERRSRSRGRCQRSRSRDKHRSRYHHYRSTSRDRYRSHRYSRSRSRSRSHSRLSSREKTKDIGSSSNKLVSLPLPISTGAMTPQMALQQAMAQMSAKAQALTGIALPTYYNPAAVNPLKYAEQVQKRKKLWEKEKTEEQNKGTVWDKMTFAQDQDGRMTAKFRKLMGIKGEENAEQPPDENLVKDEDVVKKQEELFRNLDQQYEMARMSTHTHRGVGLGYTSQAIYPPIQK